MTACWTVPSRSAGCTVARPPLRRPRGERTASTMTTLRHGDEPTVSRQCVPRCHVPPWCRRARHAAVDQPHASTSSAHEVFVVADRLASTDGALADPHFLGMLDDDGVLGGRRATATGPVRRRGASTCARCSAGCREDEWMAAGRAVQLVEWARTHRFCGRCGTPTERAAGERAMRCPACGLLAFPRLAPAMITLVTRGDGDDEEALLARGVQFRCRCTRASPASSSRARRSRARCVREVREEVGVEVERRALRRQPAVAVPAQPDDRVPRPLESGDIVLDPTEIVDAKLVPPRRPAEHPADDLDRPQADRRLAGRLIRLSAAARARPTRSSNVSARADLGALRLAAGRRSPGGGTRTRSRTGRSTAPCPSPPTRRPASDRGGASGGTARRRHADRPDQAVGGLARCRRQCGCGTHWWYSPSSARRR